MSNKKDEAPNAKDLLAQKGVLPEDNAARQAEQRHDEVVAEVRALFKKYGIGDPEVNTVLIDYQPGNLRGEYSLEEKRRDLLRIRELYEQLPALEAEARKTDAARERTLNRMSEQIDPNESN